MKKLAAFLLAVLMLCLTASCAGSTYESGLPPHILRVRARHGKVIIDR